MLSDRLLEELNDQFNREMYSGYLYLAMSAFFEDNDLPGMAHWMRAQAAEEQQHAMKFYNYIADRGDRIELQAIEQPPQDFASPVEAFEQALEHEEFITERIDALYKLSLEEGDPATQNFLGWFVTEQVEEEKTVNDILARFQLAGDHGPAMLVMDRELGGR